MLAVSICLKPRWPPDTWLPPNQKPRLVTPSRKNWLRQGAERRSTGGDGGAGSGEAAPVPVCKSAAAAPEVCCPLGPAGGGPTDLHPKPSPAASADQAGELLCSSWRYRRTYAGCMLKAATVEMAPSASAATPLAWSAASRSAFWAPKASLARRELEAISTGSAAVTTSVTDQLRGRVWEGRGQGRCRKVSGHPG